MTSSKKKTILILIAIGCLYFVGVASIIYPMLSNIMSLNSAKTVINGYDETVRRMDQSEIKEKLSKAQQYNKEIYEQNYDSPLATVLNGEDDLICYVEIPTINVYLPVYYGTSDEVLFKGCGLLEKTSLPIGGENTHSVISAHTGLPSAEMFTKLDQVKKGDVFYIHILNETLAYQVDHIAAVSPKDTRLLSVEEKQDYVTLLTCTPYGINDKRLLVRGTRIEYQPGSDDDAVAQQSYHSSAENGLSTQINQQMAVVWMIVIASVVVFAVACIWVMLAFVKKSSSRHLKNDDLTSGGTDV